MHSITRPLSFCYAKLNLWRRERQPTPLHSNPLLVWGIPGTQEPGGPCGVARSWTLLKQLSMQTQPENPNCRILIACRCVCVCVCVSLCVCVSRSVVSDSCDPTAHGVFRQEYWSGLPFSSSRGSSRSRDGTCVFRVSCIGRRILYPLVVCQ